MQPFETMMIDISWPVVYSSMFVSFFLDAKRFIQLSGLSHKP